jgi:hypothetical protein
VARSEQLTLQHVDLTPLITHQYALDDIEEAFDLFSHQRGGVLKVALYPGGVSAHRRTKVMAAEPLSLAHR